MTPANSQQSGSAYRPVRRHDARRRGAAAILAMMFLVIFGSLAAAMAIVSQGNLRTADTHLKLNRALAAAETGLMFVKTHLDTAANQVYTRDGVIDTDNATDLWVATRDLMLDSLSGQEHNISEPVVLDGELRLGPIAVGPGAPRFTARITPHPLPGENYNSAYYQRPPYSTMSPAVSSSNPLGANWVRIRVEATDGTAAGGVTRSICLDFQITKKIRYALLSRSRVMIGRNVMIEGPIGSRFLETSLENGHPIQMVSDFSGLDAGLDTQLQTFAGVLATNDINGDNRININHPTEVEGINNPQDLDVNSDGYIDDYDYFVAHYDAAPNDKQITAVELNTSGNIYTAQLMQLIDTFGDPGREGYNDGVIDNRDDYAKVRGQVKVLASMQDWNDGAADGQYQDYFHGPIVPDHNQSPLTFQASESSVHSFEPSDFDVATFRNMATGNLVSQATTQAAQNDPSNPSSPQPLGTQQFEAVPYGAAHPYDYYDRPVFQNMTFTNVKIPKGTNALFKNCKFIGVTFVETDTNNTDSNFNYVGMVESSGSAKYPGLTAVVNGSTVANTKTVSNNVRFDDCTFEGAVVSDAPPAYTHVRNKLAFTGTTRFHIDSSQNLTSSQKQLFKRSTVLAPHYSVEMGTFVSPAAPDETLELSGTIVAGVIDIRGQVKINGSLITTFEPVSNTGPVMGDTSPQFNTTLGYFPSAQGDLESELPAGGIGVVQLRYDPTLPLPDGILGPISVEPVWATYFEGGK
jgi:hypothetical protein